MKLENKGKIVNIIKNNEVVFDKDNSYFKKEFDIDFVECQHKYQPRVPINKNLVLKENSENNVINTNSNKNNNDQIENIKEEKEEKKENKKEEKKD